MPGKEEILFFLEAFEERTFDLSFWSYIDAEA